MKKTLFLFLGIFNLYFAQNTIQSDSINQLKEVDLVLGNKEKLQSEVWNKLNFEKTIQVDNILLENETVPTHSLFRVLEKISIQKGAVIEDKIISGADHFFNEHHEEMMNAVKEYLDEYLK